MEAVLIFTIIVLIAVAGFEAYVRVQDRKVALKVQGSLLDRLAAPDFNTYKMYEAQEETAKTPTKVVSLEDIQNLQDANDVYPV